MALILNLETSTGVCSVALGKNGNIIDFIESKEGLNHSKLLAVFANEIVSRNRIDFNNLDAIAVSGGPGSYTGLRIGVSFAKGICYGCNIPLIAINPLKAMAWYVGRNLEKFEIEERNSVLLCPMIDARRMEVYTSGYDKNLKEIFPVNALIIDDKSFSDYMKDNLVVFFGSGSAKCQDAVSSENSIYVDGIFCSAKFMVQLSDIAFKNDNFVDLAYFEPYYLKDFIAGKSGKNILKS